MAGLTALLLAGRRPGTDPLAVSRGVDAKTLIPLAGRPMAARVVDTLLACPEIEWVRVLTQDGDALAAVLPADPRVALAPSADRIAPTVLEAARGGGRLLVTTADHPLLSPATIASFLSATGDVDVAIGVVERRVVLRRFPRTRRTWLRFRGGAWTGANLFLFAGTAALPVIEAWASVEQDRKKGWRMIARFGPLLLLRALTRTITIEGAARAAGRRLGARVRVVPLDDPFAAVDIDTTADLRLVEAVLEERA